MVGIDVEFDADLMITIWDANNDASKVTIMETRPMTIRLESDHFIDKLTGFWRIADVDNYFASGLLDEEYDD